MTPGTPLEPWSVYVIFGTWTYTDDKKLGILVITDTEGIIYPCESEGETWKTGEHILNGKLLTREVILKTISNLNYMTVTVTNLPSEKEWLRKYLAAFRIGGDTGRASVKSDEQVLDIQLRNVWDSFPSCRASSLSALAMHALKSTAGVKRAAAMDDSLSDSAFAQRLSGCRNPFAHSNGVLSRLPPNSIQLVGPLVQEDVFGPNYRRGDSDSSEERKERGKDWHGFNYTSRSTRQRMEKEMTNKPNEHIELICVVVLCRGPVRACALALSAPPALMQREKKKETRTDPSQMGCWQPGIALFYRQTSMPASDAWPRPPMISGAGWHRTARAPGTVQMSLHPLGPI
ncbi:hypothetical protein DFH11DRAFT_1552569 [Phellopilus nigrolimitatus]|nr:hypothetical protein DFH11DRAFT_1552569 [Phellopilus nigrolimitatus]